MNNQIENRSIRICLWLIKTLQKYKRMTLIEIRERWRDSEFYVEGTNPLPRQSFVEYRNTTEDLLKVEIACDRRTNEYYLANKDDSKLTDWLISSFSISNLAREQQDVRDRILLDAPSCGTEYFEQITEAFRNNFAMKMTYRKFTDAEAYSCFIEPFCLKHDKQRWYMLARKDHRTYLQTFALDRILDLQVLPDSRFVPDEDFSPRQYYADSFGVIVGKLMPVNIRIRAYGVGRDYLRTAPLHASQKEVWTQGEMTDFKIFCRPSRDLLLHLLGQGADVEVMEPVWFREEIATEARKIVRRYQE